MASNGLRTDAATARVRVKKTIEARESAVLITGSAEAQPRLHDRMCRYFHHERGASCVGEGATVSRDWIS
jgi:hypothetical protein